jgi:hypothetical protein
VYAYQVGTPSTATIDHCTSHRRGYSCTATWNINGTSSSGPVEGLKGSLPVDGQKEQVRVHDGTAYTAGVWNPTRLPVWWFLAIIAIGVGYWFIRRRMSGAGWSQSTSL